jgi:hypothetical protein
VRPARPGAGRRPVFALSALRHADAYAQAASLSTTWALIAAAILCIPANLMPMMVTASLLGSQEDTIMSGVVFLWQSGSWPLATVVFFASVMVPLLKIIALIYLAASAQRRSRHNLIQRTRLYRLVEFVGRWSMLDIYVITILVALVQFQGSPPSRPARRGGLRGGGGADHVCRDELRPPPDLGPPRRPADPPIRPRTMTEPHRPPAARRRHAAALPHPAGVDHSPGGRADRGLPGPRTWYQQGPDITIRFKTGEGLGRARRASSTRTWTSARSTR